MPQQEKLLELPATQQEAAASAERPRGPRKLKRVDHNQWKMLTLDVDTLVSADHRARAIWELTGILDLSAFEDEIRSEEGCAGRQHTDPRLLVAIWLYAYSESISSARAVSRQMEHEPGFRWLAGLEVINHTTLSEFRTSHRESLDEIFTQLLAVMAGAGLVDLEQVMHDGTKIEAQASRNSFRREKTVQKRLEQARRVVEQLGDPEDEQQQSRREAAVTPTWGASRRTPSASSSCSPARTAAVAQNGPGCGGTTRPKPAASMAAAATAASSRQSQPERPRHGGWPSSRSANEPSLSGWGLLVGLADMAEPLPGVLKSDERITGILHPERAAPPARPPRSSSLHCSSQAPSTPGTYSGRWP